MQPRHWRIIHAVAFIVFTLSLGALFAVMGGVLESEIQGYTIVLLVVAAIVQYASDPRRSWMLREERKDTV